MAAELTFLRQEFTTRINDIERNIKRVETRQERHRIQTSSTVDCLRAEMTEHFNDCMRLVNDQNSKESETDHDDVDELDFNDTRLDQHTITRKTVYPVKP